MRCWTQCPSLTRLVLERVSCTCVTPLIAQCWNDTPIRMFTSRSPPPTACSSLQWFASPSPPNNKLSTSFCPPPWPVHVAVLSSLDNVGNNLSSPCPRREFLVCFFCRCSPDVCLCECFFFIVRSFAKLLCLIFVRPVTTIPPQKARFLKTKIILSPTSVQTPELLRLF